MRPVSLVEPLSTQSDTTEQPWEEGSRLSHAILKRLNNYSYTLENLRTM